MIYVNRIDVELVKYTEESSMI